MPTSGRSKRLKIDRAPQARHIGGDEPAVLSYEAGHGGVADEVNVAVKVAVADGGPVDVRHGGYVPEEMGAMTTVELFEGPWGRLEAWPK